MIQQDFDVLSKLRDDGWRIDPDAKSSGPMAVPGVGVVYHLVKYTEADLKKMAFAQQLQPLGPEIESFIPLELVPQKDDEKESNVDVLLKKGYVILERYSKLVHMVKYKQPQPPAEVVQETQTQQ